MIFVLFLQVTYTYSCDGTKTVIYSAILLTSLPGVKHKAVPVRPEYLFYEGIFAGM
jgi:hypothetical protein